LEGWTREFELLQTDATLGRHCTRVASLGRVLLLLSRGDGALGELEHVGALRVLGALVAFLGWELAFGV
jgi:hypothetical protein